MEELPRQREEHTQSLYKEEHIKNKSWVVGAKRNREYVVLGNAGKEGDGQHMQGPECPLILPLVTTQNYRPLFFLIKCWS